MDAIRQRSSPTLGEDDADVHPRRRQGPARFEVAGRALFYLPPAWPLARRRAVASRKILDNMEIGHNVMHGQYDWMGDPGLNSRMYEWDTCARASSGSTRHNYIHHTYTNILGKDRDIGYGILRMDEDQKWRPYYLGNPVYAFLLMTFFEWGVLLHDLEVENIMSGERTWEDTKHLHRGMIRKVRQPDAQGLRAVPAADRAVLPADPRRQRDREPGPQHLDVQHHLLRPLPGGRATFTEEETENESRGSWYYRQLLGSANITGSKLLHLMSGNLSHQIEHHLFPDIPARRYPEIAVEVQEICERYGLQYNTGPLHKQLGSVAKKIVRLALPPRRPAAA